MSNETIVKPSSREVVVAPFAIEADEPRNGDLLIQSIPGCRLRSAVSATKPVKDAKTGMEMIPPDQSAYLGQFPPIPGMQLSVNPAALTYSIIDPLAANEELCDQIKAVMDRKGGFRTAARIRGIPTHGGKLDVHSMKTLVRETIWLLDSNCAKIAKGPAPTIEQADSLPGNYLLNPGSRVPNTQPKYEKDWDEWVQMLTRAGG